MNTQNTQYPINIESASDLEFASLASTAEEAIAVVRQQMLDGFEEDGTMGLPTCAHLSERQVSRVYRTRDAAREYWNTELETGPYSLSQVYGGWIVMVESWITA